MVKAMQDRFYKTCATMAIAKNQLVQGKSPLRKSADGAEISENAVVIAVLVLVAAVGLTALAAAVSGIFDDTTEVLKNRHI